MSDMSKKLARTELLLGADAINKLAACRVAIFGVGGVGGYVVEALARSGIGALDIIDNDEIAVSNINRQIIATEDTIGMSKVEAAKSRILSINPSCRVVGHKVFYLPDNAEGFDFREYDYIVDAIDTVAAKLDIITRAYELGVPLISAMGCGNRFDPTKLVVTDINKTENDPLAKVIRKELRNRGVKHLKVVYSTELPIKPLAAENSNDDFNADAAHRKAVPGSTAFVPPAAGLIIASEVVRDLTGFNPGARTKSGQQ